MAFEKFMHNKYFHPASIQNIKKVWEAEQREVQEKKKQEELRQQYLKEQEIYKNKEQLGKANPLSFMYDPPPGYDKEQGNQERLTLVTDGEPPPKKDEVGEEGKFDWQVPGRKAPREDTAKDVSELKDQPFGVEVRNTKCVKCGKRGHINTDKICPLFGVAKPDKDDTISGADQPTTSLEDGLMFNQRVLDRRVNNLASNQQMVLSDEEYEDGSDLDDLLGEFSKDERKIILREVAKMSTDSEIDEESPQKKKKKRSKESRRKRKRNRSLSYSDSEEESSKKKKKKRKRNRSPSYFNKEEEKTKTKRSKENSRKHIRSRSPSYSVSEEDRPEKKKLSKKSSHKHRSPAYSDLEEKRPKKSKESSRKQKRSRSPQPHKRSKAKQRNRSYSRSPESTRYRH